ncbi:GNAT family N-acetyltransferase [Bacillus sp. ISL-35]|uniref:GNAT family N-acetyltransferase n=1 Tax=Bacillus sp. ISL-35 TaxID=2819122 RepID=UPI001BE54E97|nr:GNAT family N-acetyltransferase [Bacillus sp. ISL-35]MBT2681620.1 GNAT family N-acetyltransferase [Bacillus sp. ISL-35]MBT2705106.1 GNAT family N-acetyltransferase [Chryseobacterium sp. ISL-80]
MFKFREINKDEELLNQVAILYQQVWAQEDLSIKERVMRHAVYAGYRGFVAISSQGEVAGYAYGYSSLPGQYYHGLLSEALHPEEYQTWLTDCFEFVELGVLPAFRNQGLAKELVNRLLDGTGHETAVLTTQLDNNSARGLYKTLGWEVIKQPFYPSEHAQPYVIMGKHL